MPLTASALDYCWFFVFSTSVKILQYSQLSAAVLVGSFVVGSQFVPRSRALPVLESIISEAMRPKHEKQIENFLRRYPTAKKRVKSN